MIHNKNRFMIKTMLSLIVIASVPVYAVGKDGDVSLGDFLRSCAIHGASGAAAAVVGCATFVATGKNGTAPAIVTGLVTLAGTQASTRAMSSKSLSSRADAIGFLPGILSFLGTLLLLQKNGYLAK